MTRRRVLGLVLVLVAGAFAVGCFRTVERVAESPTPSVASSQQPEATPRPTTQVPTATAAATVTSASVTPGPTEAPTSTIAPSGTLTPAPTATSAPWPVITPADPPVQQYGLYLEIEGLTEESVVRGDTVVARGRTTPDALLSINGVVIPVDESGSFEVLLTLDPGPNLIEVVASDLEGNEERKTLAVVSLPESSP